MSAGVYQPLETANHVAQFTFCHFFFLYMSFLSDDNEGSSSDTAPLFQMAGDGRSTDDIGLPLLFLFHKEGNILLEALKEYREVEVLLSDKARDRGWPSLKSSLGEVAAGVVV